MNTSVLTSHEMTEAELDLVRGGVDWTAVAIGGALVGAAFFGGPIGMAASATVQEGMATGLAILAHRGQL
jgi:hypothetical protein